MAYGFKLILTTVAGVTVLVMGLLIVSGLLSAPSRGKKLVKALGIPRPAVVAHRGASYLAPEETRPAFLMARELGADYLEFDIQRTKDGVLIALHDDTLSRTTDVAEIFPGRVNDTVDTFTFAELQQLDAGSWFNRRFPERARGSFKGLNILRLEDILEIAGSGPHRPGIYIETKAASRFPGIERQLVETLAARGWIGGSESRDRARLIFQSFEPESLVRLKELAPDIPRLLLIDEVMTGREGWDLLLKKASGIGAGIGTWGHRWAFGPHWSSGSASMRYLTTWPWYTGQAHRAGLFVHPWTIDDRWEMWMVTLSGADGIFTNRTELALAVYGRAAYDNLNELWGRIGY
jgi:glycerophosphoryl diester phosphodiesterase